VTSADTREREPETIGPAPAAGAPLAASVVTVATAVVGVVVVLVALVAIGGPLFGRGTLHGAGITSDVYPWKADADLVDIRRAYAPVNDTVESTAPGLVQFADRVRGGDWPLWNPDVAGGKPLASVPGNGYSTPWAIPWLVLPDWMAPAYQKLFEVAVAGGFTFLFLRRLALTRAAALTGGMIFMLSGFLVAWTNWPHAGTAALIPAVFWSSERSLQLRTARSIVPVAVALAWMTLSGFPAVVFFTLVTLVPCVVLRALASARPDPDPDEPAASSRERSVGAVRRGVPVAAGLGLGAMLAAFAVLPWREWMSTIDLAYRERLGSVALPFASLLTLGVPKAFGSPLDGDYWGGHNIIEREVFLGAGACVLAAIGVALLPRRRERAVPAFFVAAAAVWIGVVYVHGTVFASVRDLPGFESNPVGRARSVLGFVLAVLAAYGVDSLQRGPHRPAAAWMRVWAAAVGVVALGLAFRLVRSGVRLANRAGEWEYFERQLRLPVVVAVVVVLAAVAMTRLRRPAVISVALVAIAVGVGTESVAFARGLLPRSPRDEFYAVTPTHRFLTAHLGHDRFGANDATMWPSTQTAYGLRGTTGHVFHDPAWVEVLEQADAETLRRPTFSFLRASESVVRSPALDRLAVRYFVLDPQLAVFGRVVPAVAAAGTTTLRAGTPVEVPIATGRLRAISPTVTRPARLADTGANVRVQLLDADGTVVAEGRRRLFGTAKAGPMQLALPGETAPAGGHRVRIELDSAAPADELALAADGAGRPALAATVADPGDGLRLVFADGTTVYERRNALPRVRWASRTVVEPDSRARLARIHDGYPPDTAILSAPAPAARGGEATVRVTSDDGDRVEAQVDAEQFGYVVVADAIQFGWEAKVDGRRVDPVDADHALVAVPVPAGRHTVEVEYVPPGRTAGVVLSLVALVVLVGLGVAAALAARLRPPATARTGGAE
jgi:hypothetical protein